MPEALNVLVTEPIMGRFRDTLTRSGTSPHRWTFRFDPDPAAVAAADVLVCSAAGPELLAAAPDLRLVHVTGAGLDGIAFDALGPRTAVVNTFHHGRSIAEHVVMTAMMLLRRVPAADRDLRAGVWRSVMVDDTHPFGGMLTGRTIGIIGFGEIGGEVARLAGAMGMRVRAVRRNPAAPLPGGVEVEHVGPVEELPQLLAASDVVVVTVPLDDSTRGLVDAAALAAMRRSAVLVNVARGAVVDEDALHDALSRGVIAGAGIDVWWRSPRHAGGARPSDRDFTGFANVVLTPHQSGHTEETFLGRAHDIADNVDALAAGHPLRNVVRAPLLTDPSAAGR